MFVENVLPIVLGISILSLAVAALLARQVLAADTGSRDGQISDAIREGAEAFLSRQYRTIGVLADRRRRGDLRLLLPQPGREEHRRDGRGDRPGGSRISFLIGALCSAVAGYVGMFVSIRANMRTAAAAR